MPRPIAKIPRVERTIGTTPFLPWRSIAGPCRGLEPARAASKGKPEIDRSSRPGCTSITLHERREATVQQYSRPSRAIFRDEIRSSRLSSPAADANAGHSVPKVEMGQGEPRTL